MGALRQIIFHCVYHPLFILAPTRLCVPDCPKLACHHPSLAEAGEFCLHGALLYLSHLDHSATKKLMSFEPKVSKIVRHLSSLASFKIRLRSTSTSSGPNKASNASSCTFTLKLLSRYFFLLAIIVLSLALHPLPSSSFLPWSLTKEENEFCTSVGGVILLLESWGGFHW